MRPMLAVWLAALSFAASAQPADSRLREIYQREWTWRLKEYPQLASSVGVHDYDDRLAHVDQAHDQARVKYWTAILGELDNLDRTSLSPNEKTNYAIHRAQITDSIAAITLHRNLMPLNGDSSFYADLAFLPRTQPVGTVAEIEAYLKRLAAIPDYLEENTALLRAGMKSGFVLPKIVLAGRDKPLRDVSELKDPRDSAFFAPLKNLPTTVSATDRDRLQNEAAKIIGDRIIPAFAKLLAFYNNQYVPKARSTIAATSLPNGEVYYQQQIREQTSLDLTPEAIHAIGLSEVARIHAEMEGIIKELKFDGDFAAFLKFLRSDPQFYAKTPEELLMRASRIAKRIDGLLPRYFGKLPRLPYGVDSVPDAIAPFYTGGRYVEPSGDGKTSGTYWVNTFALPSRPLYVLPSLTLHEAVPGHHLQIALAIEQTDLPAFRRTSYIAAYAEGWALYSEHLGVEMGIYQTPYEQFGRLTYEMWRACRLVVDTGMHALGWSRARAIAFLKDNTALSEHEIGTEIDRYIGWPAQALGYKLGELKIRELRTKAEKELGASFDLRAFHDVVLASGSVPLPILEQRVNDYIVETGKVN
jgi:uncharacterized protein (DUF885 family)